MRVGFKNGGGQDLHLSRVFAGGHVFTESVLDKLLCEGYYNPRIIKLIELICLPAESGATIYLRPVPAVIANRSFFHLFDSFLRDQGVQAIGLYRSAKDSNNQSVQYVLTNPPKELKVLETDAVFVLALRQGDSPSRASETRASSRLSECVRASTAGDGS